MTSITIYVLLVFSGVCLYAVFNHLAVAFRASRIDVVHLYFAGICIAMIGFNLTHIQAYAAQDLSHYLPAHKSNLLFVFLSLTLFQWFVARFTGVCPKKILMVSSAVFAALAVVNVIRPDGVAFDDIERLQFVQLPWGEVIANPVGSKSVYFYVAASLVLAVVLYALYALARAWRRDRKGTTLAMLLSVGVFLLTVLQGIAVRAGLIDFVHLGALGLIMMVIVMSFALSQDTRQRVAESEQRFRSLVEQSPFSIQVMAPDGVTLQVNSAWERLWGIKQDALGHYNILRDQQLIDKQVMPYIEAGFAGEPTEIPPVMYSPAENPLAPGPQRDRWVRAFIYPIRDHLGKVHDVILMHEDITRKKREQDALRLLATGMSSMSGENFLRQLVFNAAQAVNADCVFVALIDEPDDAFVKTLAMCTAGKNVENIHLPLPGTPYADVMEHSTLVCVDRVQLQYPRVDLLEGLKARGFIGMPLFDSRGRLLGLMAAIDSRPLNHVDQLQEIMSIFAARAQAEIERMHILHDREQLQVQFLQSQKMESLGQLAAGIAHDFNNYLSSIIGYSDLAKTKLDVNDPSYRYFSIISDAGDRAAMVTRQLLAFSRKQYTEMEIVDVNQLVPGTLKILCQIVGRQIHVNEQLQSRRKIQADRGQIEQIIVNLFINARDAMPDGGEVRIATQDRTLTATDTSWTEPAPQGEYLMLSISDTGEGMSEAVSDRIFEPFFTTKEMGKGTGLGLATVRSIVSDHRGYIRVTSEPGRGTQFDILFPATDAAIKHGVEHERPELPGGTQTLLVVDDDPDVRRLIVETLQPLGYTCLVANNGEDALQLAQTLTHVDLLVTDVIMPGMSGRELSEYIKRVHTTIQILFVSGYSENEMVKAVANGGHVEYMAKPFTSTNLAFKVYKVLNADTH